jgi:hypothetical protein
MTGYQVRRLGDQVRLFTRRSYDWSTRYRTIAVTATLLRAKSFTLDGDAVMCGPDGVAIFDALHLRGTVSEAMLYAFDLRDCAPRKTPADGISAGAYALLDRQASEVDTEPRPAVAESNPEAAEPESDSAVPTIEALVAPAVPTVEALVAPAVPTVTTVTKSVDGRPATATVVNSRLNTAKPGVSAPHHALAAVEGHAATTAVLGLRGGSGDRRCDGQSGKSSEQRLRHLSGH